MDRYVLERIHARGGLGQIWVARDQSIGREVAYKEVLPELSHRSSIVDRFAREARITGRLEHPGIVPVYELSRRTDTGQPFYTMRFVRGRTLSAASRAYHQQLLAGAATELDRQVLLTAFIAVANAVAYAHSRGIIHRDLKGDNVILGDFGEVILLDWGIAKVLGQTDANDPDAADDSVAADATLAGQIIGTPAFMAPEQAQGQIERIGPRTDVYGLGAILYELLTGRPPFQGRTSAEIVEKILREEAPSPRSINPHAPRALEAICLRALAREPADRYGTAGELADEVRRFIADEPVTAWREPWRFRARRWARHHRPLVAGAAALLVTAVVALAVGTLLLQRQQSEVERQRVQAEENFKLARGAVDQFLTRVGGSPELKARGLETLRRQLLGSARDFYEQFAQRRGNDFRARADLAEATVTLANIQHQIGQDDIAEQLLTRAIDLFEDLTRRFPLELALRRRWCGAIADRAQHQSNRGKAELAEQGFLRAIEIHAGMPDAVVDPAFLRLMAGVHDNLGTLYSRNRRLPEAEAAHRRGLAIRTQLQQELPGDEAVESELLFSHVNLIGLYATRGQLDEAALHVPAALALGERLLNAHPEQPDLQHQLATALNNVGGVSVLTGRPAEARQAYERALALRQSLVRDHPSIREYQLALASSCINLGELESRESRPSLALDLLDRGLGVLQGILGVDARNAMARTYAAYARGWRARSLDQAGQGPEAMAEWDRAMAMDDRADPALRSGWCLALARNGPRARAVGELEALMRGGPIAPESQFEAAQAFGLLAAGEATAADREQAQARAWALLQALSASGFFKSPPVIESLRTNIAFAPLRSRPEFRRLAPEKPRTP